MGENILVALKIMGFGMAGIFAAIVVIMLIIWLLQKIDGVSEKKKKEAEPL